MRGPVIGVGIVTFRRPDYYEQAAGSIVRHLGRFAGWVGAVHDGPADVAYPTVSGIKMQVTPTNRGVAAAKNVLLRSMMSAKCDWLFLAEDDVVVDSPLAVLGYIEACRQSGYEHLMFHGHGANDLVEEDGAVSYWWAGPGAWTCFSRHAIECAGYLDEGFVNCFEHAEHSLRLAECGLTSGWRRWADATGSEGWLHEIPGSLETSRIRENNLLWVSRCAEGRLHWLRAHPSTAAIVFGE
jgi:GT2 family glycosyltransferase